MVTEITGRDNHENHTAAIGEGCVGGDGVTPILDAVSGKQITVPPGQGQLSNHPFGSDYPLHGIGPDEPWWRVLRDGETVARVKASGPLSALVLYGYTERFLPSHNAEWAVERVEA